MSKANFQTPILKLRNVRRRFQLGETTIDALHGVSLDIHAGEFLAVWGPSGSGKTTLMNIIGLIDSPTSGEVHFGEQATRGLSDNALTEFRARKIGFVFQNFNLVPVLSALENVMLPLQIQGIFERSARERARAALVDVWLERAGVVRLFTTESMLLRCSAEPSAWRSRSPYAGESIWRTSPTPRPTAPARCRYSSRWMWRA